MNTPSTTINYNAEPLEITGQARLIARYYKAGFLKKEAVMETLDQYLDWLYNESKKINPKKPIRVYLTSFIRSA